MGIPSAEGGLGDVLKFLEIISIVGTGIFVVFKVGRTTERFELVGQEQAKEITELKDAVKAVAAAQSASISDRAQIVNQGAQLVELRREVNLLRMGRGFIQGAVDGEWPK